MKNIIAATGLILVIGMAGVAYGGNGIMEQAREYFKPIPFGIPELKGDAVTTEKINLGKMLYFERRLSKSALISCNFCHDVGMGGDDDQETSTGHGWQRGPRNSPTVFNSVYNIAQFWDGRAKDLQEQAKGPVQAAVEMDNTPEGAVKTLKSMPEYVRLFKKAFPNDKDPLTFNNMAAAIEVFEATLTTPDSRFDQFLRGEETALDKDEQKGLSLFMAKGCVDCHGGINMGGQGYFAFGVVARPAKDLLGGDKGRMKITLRKSDEYVFKAPSLRNIALTPPYFHTGKVWALDDAVKIMGSSQLGAELNKKEIGLIVSFLKTTTGRQPEVVYPILPASTKSTPKPVLK